VKKEVPNSEGTRFKKGETGNPNGRPKKLPELDKLLADVLGKETDGLTQAEIILNKLMQLAKNGDIRASEILLDRAYGKSKQLVQTQDITEMRITRRVLNKGDKGD